MFLFISFFLVNQENVNHHDTDNSMRNTCITTEHAIAAPVTQKNAVVVDESTLDSLYAQELKISATDGKSSLQFMYIFDILIKNFYYMQNLKKAHLEIPLSA